MKFASIFFQVSASIFAVYRKGKKISVKNKTNEQGDSCSLAMNVLFPEVRAQKALH